jgi:hypothetical protein
MTHPRGEEEVPGPHPCPSPNFGRGEKKIMVSGGLNGCDKSTHLVFEEMGEEEIEPQRD